MSDFIRVTVYTCQSHEMTLITPPHSNLFSKRYTTYDMFERKTCVKNKIIKNGESKHLNVARIPPCLKAREGGISNNATDMTN